MNSIYNDDKIPQEEIFIEYLDICRVRITKFGSGTKPILLIPSFISPGSQYKFIFRECIESNFAFYAVDLPGWIGKSKIYREKKLLKTPHSEIIDFVVEKLGFEKIDMVGYSYGGAIALESQRKNKLTLISPVFYSELFRNLGYIKKINRLKYLNFRNYFAKRFVRRYIQIANPKLEKQMTKKSFEMYLELFSGINYRVINRDIQNILNIDLLSTMDKLDQTKVLYVHSKKEKEFFQNHHKYALQNYKFKFQEFYTSHDDFALCPDGRVVEGILEFYRGG